TERRERAAVDEPRVAKLPDERVLRIALAGPGATVEDRRLAGRAGEVEVVPQVRELRIHGREDAVVVEPRLADGDGARTRRLLDVSRTSSLVRRVSLLLLQLLALVIDRRLPPPRPRHILILGRVRLVIVASRLHCRVVRIDRHVVTDDVADVLTAPTDCPARAL